MISIGSRGVRTRRAAAAMGLTLALAAAALAGAAPASADTSKAAYSWHVADEVVQAAGSAEWAFAGASNGDTMQIRGTGLMDAGDKTASGGGRFVHNAAGGGSTAGDWVATSLVSFHFYGCGGEGFPPNFCGGQAKLNAVFTPDANPSVHLAATVVLDCLIGDKIPASAKEGVTVNVKDRINFNETLHHPAEGFTLFIEQ